MTTSIIAKNFFKLSEKQLRKIGGKTLNKMEKAAESLSREVLDVVAHRPHTGQYSIQDQFIKLRTTGRKGGEFFKVQGPEIASDMSPVSPVKVRTETRGKQDAEVFAQEKLNLIAKFKNTLRDETSEHVNVKFATEGGGLRRRKITDQTVDRYKEAVAAFKTDENKALLGKLKNETNTVETRILKQGQFQIRQTTPAVQVAEENIATPAKQYTVNLVQGKQGTTEYVHNGLQIAKQFQERPETIGKKFLVNNTTTQTFRGRVPSAAKIQEYEKAKDSLNKHEKAVGIMQQYAEAAGLAPYRETIYHRQLTGKNQYVVKQNAEGPKERYTLTPHKEPLSQFVDKANQFAHTVAFQRPEISPNLMVKQGHLDADGIQKYGTATTIFKGLDVPRFDAETSTLKMRLKGNGKFSIKDVRPQPAATEDAAANIAEESAAKLRSIKLRQGSQDFSSFVENGIQFANLKKQHNQFMSESFGVKGNWLTGNRVKDKGLSLRKEAIQFFDARGAELQKLQEAGLSFKLRKHGKIALQYGENTMWGNAPVKSLSQRNDEGLTGFLTRGVAEAKVFLAAQEQKAARPSSLLGAAQQQRHTQLEELVSNLDSQVLPKGFSLVPQNGNLLIQKNGRTLETLKSRDYGKQPAGDILQDAVHSAHRFDQAVPSLERSGFLNGLRNRRASQPDVAASAAQAPAIDKSTIGSPLEAQGGNHGRVNTSVRGASVSSGNAAALGGNTSLQQAVAQEGVRVQQGPVGQSVFVEGTLSRHKSMKGTVENAPSPVSLGPTQAELPSQYLNDSNGVGAFSSASATEIPITRPGTSQGAPPSPSLPSSMVQGNPPFGVTATDLNEPRPNKKRKLHGVV